MASPPKKWPAAEVAEMLGKSESTVRRWAQMGCPHDVHPLRFELEKLTAWRVVNGLDGTRGRPSDAAKLIGQSIAPSSRDDALQVASALQIARARKEHWLAKKHEIEVQRRRGKLVEIEVVQDEAARAFRACRAALLGMPGRLSVRCTGLSAGEIHEEVRNEVLRILNALSSGLEALERAADGAA